MTYETHEVGRVLRLTKEKARKSPEEWTGLRSDRLGDALQKLGVKII